MKKLLLIAIALFGATQARGSIPHDEDKYTIQFADGTTEKYRYEDIKPFKVIDTIINDLNLEPNSNAIPLPNIKNKRLFEDLLYIQDIPIDMLKTINLTQTLEALDYLGNTETATYLLTHLDEEEKHYLKRTTSSQSVLNILSETEKDVEKAKSYKGRTINDNGTLDLSNLGLTDLKDIPSSFPVHKIKELNLSHNKLSNNSFGDFISSCERLYELDLSHNKITTIKNMNQEMPLGLDTLNLSNNLIQHITPNVFTRTNWFANNNDNNFKYLEKLNLSENLIDRIDHKAFEGLENLKLLNLSCNPLTKFNSDAFYNLSSLTTIILENTDSSYKYCAHQHFDPTTNNFDMMHPKQGLAQVKVYLPPNFPEVEIRKQTSGMRWDGTFNYGNSDNGESDNDESDNWYW